MLKHVSFQKNIENEKNLGHQLDVAMLGGIGSTKMPYFVISWSSCEAGPVNRLETQVTGQGPGTQKPSLPALFPLATHG